MAAARLPGGVGSLSRLVCADQPLGAVLELLYVVRQARVVRLRRLQLAPLAVTTRSSGSHEAGGTLLGSVGARV